MLQDVLVRDPDNERAIRLLRKRTEERRLQIKRESERIARQERLDGLMARAKEAMAHQRYEDALAALDEIRSIDSQAAGVDELRTSAEAALQQQQLAALAERRIADALRHGEKRFRRGDRAGALQFVEQALTIDPQHGRALAVREEIRRAPDVPPSNIGRHLIKIAAGVIAAAVVSLAGWTFWPSRGTQPPLATTASVVAPTPTTTAPPPASTTSEEKTDTPAAATAGTRGSETKPEAKADEGPPVEPPKSEPVRDEAVVVAESTARRLLRGGRLRDAAAALENGLAVDPNDAGLKDALRNVQNEARRRSLRAMNEVEKAGMPAIASKAFAQGKQMHADGESMQAAGKASVAVQDYLTAIQLFNQALQTAPPIALTVPHASAPPAVTTAPAPSSNPGGARSGPATADAGTVKTPATAPAEKPTAPPPKAADPSPPPAVSTPATAAATPAIMKLIRQYANAWDNRDMNKLKAIWPGMSSQMERQLRKQMEDYKSVQMDITNCSPPTFTLGPHNAPLAAAITCYEKDRFDTRVSGRIELSLLTTFVLRLFGTEWGISEVSKRPV
jgi:tetratricopeptide (TPR) repeat protein